MHFIYAVLRIVFIDLVLSGDNAVVIGMAAHRLEPRRRKIAILLGGGAAIIIRVALTAVAFLLLKITGLRLAGGVLLVWIGFRLLNEEEETHEGVKVAGSMKEAVVTILVADFIMSTDNVLGVAGASEGNISLLVFGLVLSMAILMFMGSLVADLVNKFVWLAYAGSAVIVETGAIMIFEDPFFQEHAGTFNKITEHVIAVVFTAGILVLAHWFHRVRGKHSNSLKETVNYGTARYDEIHHDRRRQENDGRRRSRSEEEQLDRGDRHR